MSMITLHKILYFVIKYYLIRNSNQIFFQFVTPSKLLIYIYYIQTRKLESSFQINNCNPYNLNGWNTCIKYRIENGKTGTTMYYFNTTLYSHEEHTDQYLMCVKGQVHSAFVSSIAWNKSWMYRGFSARLVDGANISR